jgi:hypothetical protein
LAQDGPASHKKIVSTKIQLFLNMNASQSICHPDCNNCRVLSPAPPVSSASYEMTDNNLFEFTAYFRESGQIL